VNTVGAALLSDVQKEVLDEVLVGVPYNSASQFHEYFGTKAAPPRLGLSCAWQSFTAGRMVMERSGIPAEYLIDGRHVAAVYRQQDSLVILDPYLLHGEPLRLDRGAAVDGVVRTTVDAYPYRVKTDGTPAPSRVRATWDLGDDTIRLDYLRFSPRRGHNTASRSFLLRPDSRIDTVPPAADFVRRLLVHPEQHSVSIRVLHPVTRQMAELILPLAGRPAGVAEDGHLMLTKDNQGAVAQHGDARFQRDLEVVADAVSASRDDVVAFLLEAAAIHRAAAPAGLDLAPYSLEDE
jgi:hypothetical protein